MRVQSVLFCFIGQPSAGSTSNPTLRRGISEVSRSSSSASGAGDGPTPVKRPKTGTVSRFVDSMSRNEKLGIDEALARAAYAKGLPLDCYEGELFQKAFNLMRPAYGKPPSRYMMGGPLLEKEYTIIKAKNTEMIQSSNCCALMCDGVQM